MTAPKYRLPHRKWYTLPQAIKQIHKLTGEQLEIDDLIHFWTIGNLNISIFIDATQTYSNHILGKTKKCFCELGSLRVGNLIFNENIKSNEWEAILLATNTPEVDELIFFDNDDYLISIFYKIIEDEITLNISGLLPIISVFQDYTFLNRDKGISLYGRRTFFIHPNKKQKLLDDFMFTLVVNDNVFYDDKFISYESLYITDKDLVEFLNDNTDFVKKIRNKIEQENKPSTKTFNAQAQLIRDLITICYGKDVADNIRSHLDNPQSEIIRDFHKKDLNPPSGKTVQKWINEN